MIMTVVGGGLTLYLLFQPNLVVFINNETDEEITDLTLTHEGIKSDITVPAIEPGEFESIDIIPKEQTEDSLLGASLVLQYEDDSGNVPEESVFAHFVIGFIDFADKINTDINDSGMFSMTV